MLIFENVALIEAMYDSAKKAYPQLQDTTIFVGYGETNVGVSVLEGTDEDAGKYKIVVSPSDNERLAAAYFISGLSILIYKLTHGEEGYVHPIDDNTLQVNEDYQVIFKNMANAFNEAEYKGEYVHE